MDGSNGFLMVCGDQDAGQSGADLADGPAGSHSDRLGRSGWPTGLPVHQASTWSKCLGRGIGETITWSSISPATSDRPVFQEAYARYRGMVGRHVRRYVEARDVEDVTQEVFAEAWRTWAKFDPQRFGLVGWLIGIARHVASDWQRATPQWAALDDEAVFGASAQTRIDRADIADLKASLLRLSVRTRRIFVMRFVLGYSRGEIAIAMGMSQPAVAKCVVRTLRVLRDQNRIADVDSGSVEGLLEEPDRQGSSNLIRPQNDLLMPT
jgi:RNA polymerase sigma factor (sigma-70 family)